MDMSMFDELRDLAERNPEGFESLRAELIEDCLRGSRRRNQRRLRGLQFVIESRRQVAGSPMKALMDIQAMMYDSVLRQQQAIRALRQPTEQSSLENARVLSLQQSQRHLDKIQTGPRRG